MSTSRHFQEIWRQKQASSAATPKNQRVEKAASVLGHGKMLLDIGCGSGALSPLVRKRFETIIGLDFVEGVLAEARKAGEVPVCGTFSNPLPFLSNTFDVVALLSTLQYAFDPKKLLREAARVTRPGGTVFLSVPNMRVITRLVKLVLLGIFPRTSADSAGYDGGTLHYFCYRNVAELLEECGLRVLWQGGAFPRPRFAHVWPEHPSFLRKIRSEFLSAEVLVKAIKPPLS
jgi:ubiquinone/menaquinone biosynthesis C-methylase UbiE